VLSSEALTTTGVSITDESILLPSLTTLFKKKRKRKKKERKEKKRKRKKLGKKGESEVRQNSRTIHLFGRAKFNINHRRATLASFLFLLV